MILFVEGEGLSTAGRGEGAEAPREPLRSRFPLRHHEGVLRMDDARRDEPAPVG